MTWEVKSTVILTVVGPPNLGSLFLRDNWGIPASFYGYFAFKHLLKTRETLRFHGVEVEYATHANKYPHFSITRFRFHPVFLGGINNLSGNKPPWALPAKAAYQVFEGDRAKKYFNAMYIRTPDFFPTLSILVSNCFQC